MVVIFADVRTFSIEINNYSYLCYNNNNTTTYDELNYFKEVMKL